MKYMVEEMDEKVERQDIVELAILPVKNTVLFPHLALPLAVGRQSSMAAIDYISEHEEKRLVIMTQKSFDVQNPKQEDLFPIGTIAMMRSVTREHEQTQVTVLGKGKVKLLKITQESPFLQGEFQILAEPGDTGDEVEALQRVIMEQAERIQNITQPQSTLDISRMLKNLQEPLEQIYLLAHLINLDTFKAQSLLSSNTRTDALKLMNGYLAHEIQILELSQKITSDVSSKLSKDQREYYLRQQLKAIRSELGEDANEQAELKELTDKLAEAKIPKLLFKEAERELKRLERLPVSAPDYQIVRTYLELLSELPWDKTTKDNLDLAHAEKILNADHFGLKSVKERILEYLAVLNLSASQTKAPILCFVGPPGVGKTSLGESIARALERKFERISLGGMHDEAELRGHRRTYIGAMPGRIIQAIRRAGSNNPVLMFDEIDKIGRDYRGDPSAALLEILDPSQNKDFRDNYLDANFDLSKVFFIATANTLETIPSPLLDRLEVIPLSGYTEREKLEIAKRYLLQRQLKQMGLGEKEVQIQDKPLTHLIRNYTREAGVRELERVIAKTIRKIAVEFVKTKRKPKVIKESKTLSALLGPEKFFMEKLRTDSAPGVVAGLAYTPSGGDVLYIESSFIPKEERLKLTGSLGDVMKESATAAWTYIWSNAKKIKVPLESFEKNGVHIHVPSGATPKDGPSAGITMAVALASLYLNKAVPSDLAMTGEITLSGLVLPVGGIKEKVLAAQRAGMKRIILPKENQRDVKELPEEAKKHLEFHLVKDIKQVLNLVF